MDLLHPETQERILIFVPLPPLEFNFVDDRVCGGTHSGSQRCSTSPDEQATLEATCILSCTECSPTRSAAAATTPSSDTLSSEEEAASVASVCPPSFPPGVCWSRSCSCVPTCVCLLLRLLADLITSPLGWVIHVFSQYGNTRPHANIHDVEVFPTCFVGFGFNLFWAEAVQSDSIKLAG